MAMLNVKVGDKVLVKNRLEDKIGIVEKITPKGAIRVNGKLYHPDGRQKGEDVWCRSIIKEISDEELKKFEEDKFVKETIRRLNKLQTLTFNQAQNIMKILKNE